MERKRLADAIASWDVGDGADALVRAVSGISVPYYYGICNENGLATEYECRGCNKKFWADTETMANYVEGHGSWLIPVCPNKKCKHYITR